MWLVLLPKKQTTAWIMWQHFRVEWYILYTDTYLGLCKQIANYDTTQRLTCMYFDEESLGASLHHNYANQSKHISCTTQEKNKYFQLVTKWLIFWVFLLTFQVSEFEELSKTESELSFRLKQTQLVVQQVCLVYLITLGIHVVQLGDNNDGLETCSSYLMDNNLIN